jgi:glycerophosphoryl diester phosphodiesterase
VHPYTVDDEAEMQSLLALGADGIFTDRPDLLLRVVNRTPTRTAGETGCTAVAQ